jgi:hypothetical protein
MEVVCEHCGKIFERSARHKNQRYCSDKECQRARKAKWQREKMSTDADYRLNQRLSQAVWVANNPDYWRTYRKNHPVAVERNRILQSIRNRRRRKSADETRGSSDSIAKMDALKVKQLPAVGQYILIPLIAKMDALKVNMFLITDG